MRIKEGFELQNVCGENIIVPAGDESVDFSKIISLNETAAYLWQGCCAAEEFTIDSMVDLLTKEYDVEDDVAREDCVAIASRWIEMGIVED